MFQKLLKKAGEDRIKRLYVEFAPLFPFELHELCYLWLTQLVFNYRFNDLNVQQKKRVAVDFLLNLVQKLGEIIDVLSPLHQFVVLYRNIIAVNVS